MKQALIYSLKVWLTTVILGSLIMGIRIWFLYDWLADRWDNEVKVQEITIPSGLVCYLPCWFIFGLLCWYLNKKAVSVRSRYIFMSLTAIILAMAPFAIMDYQSLFSLYAKGFFAGFPPDLFWTCTYVGVTLIGTWFYRRGSFS